MQNEYNLLTPTQPVYAPADYKASAQPFTPNLPAPAPQIPAELLTYQPAAPGQGAGGSGPNAPKFTDLVKQREAQNGGKLKLEQLEELARNFKNDAIILPLNARKMAQPGIEANVKVFDEKYAEFLSRYFTPEELGTKENAPDGERGDFMRGFASYIPGIKQLGGGLAVIAGDAIGSERLRNYGMDVYNRAGKQLEAQSKETDNFTNVSDLGGVADWAQYQLGSLTGTAIESIAAAGAGALVGTSASPVGSVVGAAAGLLGKKAVKEGIQKYTNDIIKSQVANGVSREAAEEFAKKQADEAAGKVTAAIVAERQRKLAQTLGAFGLSEAPRAIADSYMQATLDNDGAEIEFLDKLQAFGFGALSGAVGAGADVANIGRITGPAGTGSLARRAVREIGGGAVREGGTETIQAILGRAGGGQDLASPEAIEEYVNSAAAGVLGGGAIGTYAASRKNKLKAKAADAADKASGKPTATPAPDTGGAASTAPDTALGAAMEAAPGVGLAEDAFNTLNSQTLSGLQTKGKRVKTALKAATTPADVIKQAERYAQNEVGEAKWKTLSLEQRLATVESITTWLGTQKSMEGLGEAVEAYKKLVAGPSSTEVAATPAVTPPTVTPPPANTNGLVEQPVIGVEGEAVPGTATAAATTQPTPTPVPQTTGDRVSEKASLDKRLREEFGVSPDLLKQLNLEQTRANLESRLAQAKSNESVANVLAEVAADPSDTATQRNKLKATAKKKLAEQEQKKTQEDNRAATQANNALKNTAEKAYLQSFFREAAGMIPEGDPTTLESIRRDPRLDAARAAYKAGQITSPDALKAFLEAEAARIPVQAASEFDNIIVSKLLSSRSTKTQNVKAKNEAKAIANALIEIGTSPEEVNKLTLAQARTSLTNLLNEVNKPKKAPAPKKAKEKAPEPVVEAPPKPAAEVNAGREVKPGKVLKKSKPAAEGKESPKQQAPEKTNSGAKAKANKPTATLAEKVSTYFKDSDYTESEITAFVDAVELAQQEDTSALSELITEYRANDAITDADIRQLRSWASEQYKAPKELLKEEIDALAEETPDEDLDPNTPTTARDVVNYTQAKIVVEEDVPTDYPDVRPPLNVQREMANIIERVRKGELTSDEALVEFRNLQESMQERNEQRKWNESTRDLVRGPEWVKERLTRALRTATNPRERSAIEFGLWLLEQNPLVASRLAISIKQIKDSGSYNPVRELVTLNSGGFGSKTVVHEILHHTERMLPPDVQAKLRGEYVGRLLNKYKQAQRNGDDAALAYLDTVLENLYFPTAANRKKALDFITNGTIDAAEYYRYFNPSEYWAETASEILARKYKADSWIAKAKAWLTEFVERAKEVLGMDNESAIYRGLREVLATSGETQSTEMLREGSGDLYDAVTDEQAGYTVDEKDNTDPNLAKAPDEVTNKELKQITKGVTGFQKFWEVAANSTYALEKAVREVFGEGKVNEQNNVMDAAFRYNGRVSWINKVDMGEHFDPIDTWVALNWQQFSETKAQFLDDLNLFFQNTHWLERARTAWLQDVKLEDGREVDRVDILEDWAEGKLSPVEARQRLERLVEKYAVQGVDSFAEDNGVPISKLRDKLAELKTQGITESSMAELNKLMDGTRGRIRERLVGAGFFPESDPWAEFYGWQWYVPLKGSAYGGEPDSNFDFIPERIISLSRLSKQIKAMEGRTSFAERPFTRLFVDMARAGERQANKEMLDTVYEFVLDHQKELKAKINVFTGDPKKGYTTADGTRYLPRLARPENGIIVNDGDTHYVITLPQNSQLLRGLTLMNSVQRPNAVEKLISVPTNTLARLYTTVSPGWQTFTGFIRDLSYIPTTIGVSEFDSPLQAAEFMGGYGKNLLKSYDAAKTIWPQIKGDFKQLTELAAEDADGYVGWMRRYQEAGGENEFTKGFDLAGTDKLFTSKLADIDGIKDATEFTWNQVLKYTGNYASFLELIGRVAAFRTLVESGQSDKQAAVTVRKTLDYQQTGLKGRRINSWLAFFRVGMTGADVMRRAFTKPMGGLDTAKLAKWSSFFGALGFMGYMASAAMLGQDEEGKDRIAKLRGSTLTQKLVFPLGDEIVGVNLGLGLPQMLMAPGILAGAVSAGHMTEGEAIREYYETVLRNGPVRPGGVKGGTPTDFLTSIVKGFVPTVARPFWDVSDNVDAFGRPIHTEFVDETKRASDQARPTTPKEFTDIARFIYDATGGTVDYYPEDIRYMTQNYGGQWVSDIVKGTMLRANREEEGREVAPFRVSERAFVSDEQFYMSNELYDTLDKLRDSKQRYNSIVGRAKSDGKTEAQAKAEADAIVAKEQDFGEQIKAYNDLEKYRKAYYKKVKAIREDKLLSTSRKQALRKRLDSELRQKIESYEDLL